MCSAPRHAANGNLPRVLILIPPLTQFNAPYSAAPMLTGFLRSRGIPAAQEDLSLQLVLALFSPGGLDVIRRAIPAGRKRFESIRWFLRHFEAYYRTIAPVIAFLQGKDPALAYRIITRQFLPEGPRFRRLNVFLPDESGDPLGWAFGALGVQDRAKHLATLYLADLADVIREGGDAHFELARYGEKLAHSLPSFSPLAEALAARPTAVVRILRRLVQEAVARHQPSLVLVTVPFPGCVYGAFRIAQAIKTSHPRIATVLGGGYVNTELRQLSDPRVFEYFDFVTLDFGERPVLALVEHLQGQRRPSQLVRTFYRHRGQVKSSAGTEPDIPFAKCGTPTWGGLRLDQYLNTLDLLNPLHRLWSDGPWLKLMTARGCYWRRCAFCDTSLPYISRFEPLPARILADQIAAAVQETGRRGFHFTDEAAPPTLLKALAVELQQRKLAISWWGNIRFEKSFTPELCQQLAASGCVAVTGGLEAATNKLLKRMNKGITLEDAVRVMQSFRAAGILVHAYLMYGIPGQTAADTVDSLEIVRQLFAADCLNSAYFHRFACTIHSPIGQEPARFGIHLAPAPSATFAQNEVGFMDPHGADHDSLGRGLHKALYNYMHGVGLDADVRSWFECPVPSPRISRRYLTRILNLR